MPRINATYLKFLLKQNTKLMIVLFSIYFLLLPFSLYNSLTSGAQDVSYYLLDGFRAITVPIILTAIVIPCLLLSFIHDRNKMDTYGSLPIRKQDFYFNHFIEALLVILIPILLNWILANLVFVLRGKGIVSLMEQGQLLLGLILYLPLLVGITHFGFIGAGRLLDGVAYGVGLHLIPSIITSMISLLFRSLIYGLRPVIPEALNQLLNPQLAFNALFNNLNPHLLFTWIMWPIIGIILYFINQNLFVNRKIEKIDDAAVFTWFKPVISTIIFFVFGLYIFMSSTYSSTISSRFVLPTLVIVIGYVIYEAISERSFKTFLQAIIKGLFISAISISLVYTTISTGFFGLAKTAPVNNDFDEVIVVVPYAYDIPKSDDFRLYERFGAKYTWNEFLGTDYTIIDTDTLFLLSNDNLEKAHQMRDFSQELIDRFYKGFKPFRDTGWMYTDGYTYETYFIYLKDNQIIERRLYDLSSNEILNLQRIHNGN